MKISHKLLIIVVLASVLFIARDDVKVVYNKALSYLPSNISPTEIKDSIIIKSEKILNSNKTVITPGALKVKSDLVYDAKDVRLSIKDVITETNRSRTENGGLQSLKENSKLDLSAQLKLQDMFKQQYFEHVSPDGVGVSDLGNKVSYEYIVIGENLALGNFKNGKALVDAWMASPGHRANILNAKYTEIGVAVGHGVYKGQDIWLAVQHFGLPRSACPTIDEVLHGTINLEENNIRDTENDLITRKQRIDSGVVYSGMTTNEQIEQYNQLVVTYNQLLISLKEKISEYNKQVRTFNSCLSTNTATSPNTH
jgi:uncharacterized protein YkwD